MTKKRFYKNNGHVAKKPDDNIPARRNGARVYILTCLCGMTQRIILSKFFVKQCVNRLAKCHHSFYLKDGQPSIGGLKKS